VIGEFKEVLTNIRIDDDEELGIVSHLCRDSENHKLKNGCCLVIRFNGCVNHSHVTVILNMVTNGEMLNVETLTLGKVFDTKPNEILYRTNVFLEPFYYCSETTLIYYQAKRLGVTENAKTSSTSHKTSIHPEDFWKN
jgi:hypothetical protein